MREPARVKGDFKMKNGKVPDNQGDIIIYTTDDGKSQVSLMSRDGCVLTCSIGGEEHEKT